MADFCLQCSGELFDNEIKNDFIGISTEADTKNGLFAVVLCEGCGPTQVDHNGKCMAPDCAEKHGAPVQAVMTQEGGR